MEKLTIQQAIEQGYKYFVYPEDGYQTIKTIVSDEPDFTRKVMLCEKEPYHPNGMDSKSIAELLADNIECNHVDETGDDTEQVFDKIKSLDFTDVEKRIEEALSTLNYYRQSEVELIEG